MTQRFYCTLDITNYPVWAGGDPLDATAGMDDAIWNWLFHICGWGTDNSQEAGKANWLLLTNNGRQVMAFRKKHNAEHFHSFWRAITDQDWDDHLAEYPTRVEISGWGQVWDHEEFGLWSDAEEWLEENVEDSWSFIRCRTRGSFVAFKRPEDAVWFTMRWRGPEDYQE